MDRGRTDEPVRRLRPLGHRVLAVQLRLVHLETPGLSAQLDCRSAHQMNTSAAGTHPRPSEMRQQARWWSSPKIHSTTRGTKAEMTKLGAISDLTPPTPRTPSQSRCSSRERTTCVVSAMRVCLDGPLLRVLRDAGVLGVLGACDRSRGVLGACTWSVLAKRTRCAPIPMPVRKRYADSAWNMPETEPPAP